MKRTVITLAGIATLGITAYVGNHLRADPPYQNQVQQASATAPAAQPRSKIAVINLAAVVQKYDKFLDFQKNTKTYLEQVRAEFERKKAPGLELKKKLSEMTPDDPQRETVQKNLKVIEREIQDLEEKTKKDITKYQDDVLVQIYREVHDAVQRYAVSNDIELVLHFNDALTEADLFHPLNVQRKMKAEGCMPIYITRGMDISEIIAANLNSHMHASAAGQH